MTERHESCCAVYNAPAYEPGPCDCKYRVLNNSPLIGERRPIFPLDGGAQIGEAVWTGAEWLQSLDEALDKAVEACMMERAGRE